MQGAGMHENTTCLQRQEFFLPFHGPQGFRGAVQILFELQLEGLANGTDDTLG